MPTGAVLTGPYCECLDVDSAGGLLNSFRGIFSATLDNIRKARGTNAFKTWKRCKDLVLCDIISSFLESVSLTPYRGPRDQARASWISSSA